MSASLRKPLVNQITDSPSFDRHASTGQTRMTVNLEVQAKATIHLAIDLPIYRQKHKTAKSRIATIAFEIKHLRSLTPSAHDWAKTSQVIDSKGIFRTRHSHSIVAGGLELTS